MRDIFILKEVWAQDKNIYFDRHFAQSKYFCLLSTGTGSKHILLPAKVRLAYTKAYRTLET
jgi:hypothetical protein